MSQLILTRSPNSSMLNLIFLDLANVCRLCLTTTELTPLSDSSLLQNLASTVQFEIKLEDQFPKKLCSKCAESTRQTLAFLNQCKITQTLLKGMVTIPQGQSLSASAFSINGSTIQNPQNLNIFTSNSGSLQINANTIVPPPKLTPQPVEKRTDTVPTLDVPPLVLCNSKLQTLEKHDLVKLQKAGSSAIKKRSEPAVLSVKPNAAVKPVKIISRNAGGIKRKTLNKPIETIVIKQAPVKIAQRKRVSFENVPNVIDPLSPLPTLQKIVEISKPQSLCDRCGLVTLDPETHDSFICSSCTFATCTRELLDTHTATCQPPLSVETFGKFCPNCGDNVNSLDRHRKENMSCWLKCHQCEYKTYRKSLMEAHQRMVHVENALNFACELCPTTFKYRFNLNRHIRVQHKEQSPMFDCKICGRKFTNQFNLDEHTSTHDNLKSHLCHVCGQSFNTLGQKQTHIRKNHSDSAVIKEKRRKINDFLCWYCGKHYQNYNSYFQHIKVHKIIKSFPCRHCSFRTSSRQTLKAHQALHVEQIPLYRCPICRKTFKQEHNFTRHCKIHENLDEP